MKNILNAIFFAIIVLIVALYFKTYHGKQPVNDKTNKIHFNIDIDNDWIKHKSSKVSQKTVINTSNYSSEITIDSISIKYKIQSKSDFDNRLRLQVLDEEGQTTQDYVFLLDSARKSVSKIDGEYYLQKQIPNDERSTNVTLNLELLE